MMKPTRVAALCLALAFLAGAVFGFVAHNVYAQRTTRGASSPKEYRERYIAKLRTDLTLSPEQVTQVTAILDQTGERFRELRERIDPDFEAIRQQQRQRIMAILTPEQQPKYQKILDEHRRRFEKERSSGKPAP